MGGLLALLTLHSRFVRRAPATVVDLLQRGECRAEDLGRTAARLLLEIKSEVEEGRARLHDDGECRSGHAGAILRQRRRARCGGSSGPARQSRRVRNCLNRWRSSIGRKVDSSPGPYTFAQRRRKYCLSFTARGSAIARCFPPSRRASGARRGPLVQFAGAQSGRRRVGSDQPAPPGYPGDGRGEVDDFLSVDGRVANVVRVYIN